MKNKKIDTNSCQVAIDELIGQMEQEGFGIHQLNQLKTKHPNCADQLQINYDLWNNLEALETPIPRPEMSIDFYKKLNEYSVQNTVVNTSKKSIWDNIKEWNFGASPQLGWALGIGLFIFGFFAGQLFQSNGQQEQINILAEEIGDLKKKKEFNVNLAQSVSGRMKDIQFVRQMKSPNAKILQALNQALCNDPNINVRLSAIESLMHFLDEPDVMTILIKAIPQQTSPIVQLELAEVMIQLEEKRSAGAWKELLESGELEIDVKMQLEETLEVLL